MANLRVPSLTDDAMKIRLPVISAQKHCNHVLYDALCTVNRVSASGTGTITAIAGNTITTTYTGTAMTFGDIEHVASGERRMVVAQTGSVLTLNAPLVEAVVGDSLALAPGCDHTITMCRDAYNNVINFGGHPDMNAAINPWVPNGLGVTQQV